MRIGLHQPLDRHAVVERLGRVLAGVDGGGSVCDDVAELPARGGVEQQLLDHVEVPPPQLAPAGVLLGDDLSLEQLHRPAER